MSSISTVSYYFQGKVFSFAFDCIWPVFQNRDILQYMINSQNPETNQGNYVLHHVHAACLHAFTSQVWQVPVCPVLSVRSYWSWDLLPGSTVCDGWLRDKYRHTCFLSLLFGHKSWCHDTPAGRDWLYVPKQGIKQCLKKVVLPCERSTTTNLGVFYVLDQHKVAHNHGVSGVSSRIALCLAPCPWPKHLLQLCSLHGL